MKKFFRKTISCSKLKICKICGKPIKKKKIIGKICRFKNEWRRRGKKTPRNFSATPPLTKWCEYKTNNNAHQMSYRKTQQNDPEKILQQKIRLNDCSIFLCVCVCLKWIWMHACSVLWIYGVLLVCRCPPTPRVISVCIFFFQNEQSLKVFFFVGQSKNNSTSNHAQFIYC